MTRHLSPFTRGLIVAFKLQGMKDKDIAVRLMEIGKKGTETQINSTFIKFVNEQYRFQLIPQKEDRQQTIKKKKQQMFISRLTNYVLQNPHLTQKEITNDKKINPNGFSLATIRSYLKKAGLKQKANNNKLEISQKNIVTRYNWCCQRRNWSDEWNKIVYTDESLFTINCIPRQLYWIRKTGKKDSNNQNQFSVKVENENDFLKKEEYDNNLQQQQQINNLNGLKKIKRKTEHKILVWGAISSEGPESIVFIENPYTSQTYIDLLKQTVDFDNLKEKGWLFQQDNSAVHKAKNVKKWMEEIDLPILPWPPQSPDLNPIENVWGVMKNKLQYYKNEIKDADSFKKVLTNLFFNNATVKKTIQNSIASIPKRVEKIIINQGNFVK